MADDSDMEMLALQGLRSGRVISGTPPEPDDMEALALTRLRPEVAKPRPRLDDPNRESAGRPQVMITGQPSTTQSSWNLGDSVLYGMSQGWSPEIMAKAKSMFGGTKYEDELAAVKAAREAYQKENSGKDLLANLGGSIATLLPMMMAGQEYAVAPAAANLARAVPAIAPALRFLSGASSGIASLPSQAVRGAAEGIASAGAQSHMAEEPLADQLKTGAGIGAVAGPVGNMLMRPFRSEVNSTVAKTAQDYMDLGGNISVGKLPGGSPIAAKLEGLIGKGRTAEQRELFQELLAKQAGVPRAKALDQDFVALADAMNGNTMNSLVGANVIPAGHPGLNQGFTNLRSKVLTDVGDPDAARIINSYLDKVESPTVTGDLTGDMYRAFTRGGEAPGLVTKMAKHPNPEVREFGNHLRTMLDNVWGDVLGPTDKAAWDTAKAQYRATRVIDSVIDPATGEFNPKKLLKAVERNYGNVNNAGDMGTLAKVGQYLGETGKHVEPESFAKKALYTGTAVAGGAGLGHQLAEHGGHLLPLAMANPAAAAIPLTLAGGAAIGGKGIEWYLNTPRNLQAVLARAMAGNPARGSSALVPAATYLRAGTRD